MGGPPAGEVGLVTKYYRVRQCVSHSVSYKNICGMEGHCGIVDVFVK